MNDWQNDPDHASVEQIVERLRAPMRLDETFEVRVMSAVHAEALVRVDAAHRNSVIAQEARRPWWRRSYTLQVSPIGGLAMAAGIFGLMLLGATTVGRMTVEGIPSVTVPVRAASADAASERVHFVLVDGTARQVWLVGDFNGWVRSGTPLQRDASGDAWAVSVNVPHGRHEYAFIVDDGRDERWIADPRKPVMTDEFGTESSVLHVGLSEESSEAAF